MGSVFEKRFSLIRSVLFTSLPAYILAELFFALLYYLIVQGTQFLYIFGSSWTTADVEANMQIFSVFNIAIATIATIGVSIVTCIEMATIIVITLYDYHRHDHIPLRSLLVFSYQSIRRLVSWRTAPLFLIVLLFPKEHIGPKGLLSLSVPQFLLDEIWRNPAYLVSFIAILVLIAIVLYRGIFIIHTMLFESDSIIDAYRRSWFLIRKMRLKRVAIIFARTLWWIACFSLPCIVIVLALNGVIVELSPYIGVVGMILSSMLSWFSDFIIVGLPGVLFLASLTITYIQYQKIDHTTLEEYLPFLASRPTHIPRWYNIRKLCRKKSFLIGGVLLISSLGTLVAIFSVVRTQSQLQYVEIIAHRGDTHGSGAIMENSLSSIQNANSRGATLVEIDIYENADGTLILSHDPNLKRVTGVDQDIATLTDERLSQIHLLNGEPIPTLEQALNIAKIHHIRLMIEPKLHGHEKHLYETLSSLIRRTDMQSAVMFHSLSLDALMELKKLEPTIPVGYIIFGGIGNFGSLPVDFYSVQETTLTAYMIKDIHEKHKKIYLWTLNSPESIKKYVYLGVDGIITDETEMLHTELQSLQASISRAPRTLVQIFGFQIPITLFQSDTYRESLQTYKKSYFDQKKDF